MFDLNAVLSAALQQAVTEATKPLLERIEKLETNCNAYEILFRSHIERIEALETRLTEAQLFQKTTEVTVPIDEARLVEVLDQQEWFWEKLNRKAGEAAEAAAEEAINQHCSDYDHDDYDNVACLVNDANLDDMVTTDNLRDEIKQVLRDVTVSIDV